MPGIGSPVASETRPLTVPAGCSRNTTSFIAWPAATFTGSPGRYVKVADTVKGFKGIAEGKYDDIPEQAFYMKGTIEEVLEAAEKMKAA